MTAEELKSIPLFADLSDDALHELETWIVEVRVSEGKHLVDEGDYAYDLFVIVEGNAEVVQDGNKVADLGPGDFFGEMGVLEKAQRSATVVSKTRMRLLTLSTWDVKRLNKAAPQVVEQLNAAIEERRRDK
ncbi:MAG: family transcriptional regulator, cyclic receptor protein [Thermoleophilaceae bacterium]|nr:family transcriptional regulator, cyclic receptor protein [Thermoleophilaceae bacterium]